MQTDRRKIHIETLALLDMLLSLFSRALIMIVVLYVLGTNTTPTTYQIIIIDVAMIWWIMYPVIKYYFIDNNDK